MKIEEVYYTSTFHKAFIQLPHSIQKRALQKIAIFLTDCFSPSLRTHKLKGKFQHQWSFSIDYRYRIVFVFEEGTPPAVTFLAVGTHGIYQ